MVLPLKQLFPNQRCQGQMIPKLDTHIQHTYPIQGALSIPHLWGHHHLKNGCLLTQDLNVKLELGLGIISIKAIASVCGVLDLGSQPSPCPPPTTTSHTHTYLEEHTPPSSVKQESSFKFSILHQLTWKEDLMTSSQKTNMAESVVFTKTILPPHDWSVALQYPIR